MAGERLTETTTSIVVAPSDARESAVQPSLVGISGSAFGHRFVLGDASLLLGRDPEACDIFIDDAGVSRKHARVERDGRGYKIVDCGSKNGTLVNGAPVTEARLSDGQLISLGTCVLKYLRSSHVELQYHDRMTQLTQTDELTGVPNRRYGWNRLASEISRARRHTQPLALILFDIDHFKKINDTHGHAAGDSVLVEVARTAMNSIRAEDVLARIGGEEFLVILPHASLPHAADTAERIRAEVESLVVDVEGVEIRATVSLGVTDLAILREAVSEDVYEESASAAEAFIALTDTRLYEAKRGGRNRVVACT